MSSEKPLELETVNKLFLELSQIATAKTGSQLFQERLIAEMRLCLSEAEEYIQDRALRERAKALVQKARMI